MCRISVRNSRLAPTLLCRSVSAQMNIAHPMACCMNQSNIKTKPDLIYWFIINTPSSNEWINQFITILAILRNIWVCSKFSNIAFLKTLGRQTIFFLTRLEIFTLIQEAQIEILTTEFELPCLITRKVKWGDMFYWLVTKD